MTGVDAAVLLAPESATRKHLLNLDSTAAHPPSRHSPGSVCGPQGRVTLRTPEPPTLPRRGWNASYGLEVHEVRELDGDEVGRGPGRHRVADH